MRLSNSILQHGFYLSDIMSIRAGYDDRQRDSILVYENMTLGCIFFLDQWDWDQLIPEQLALLSWSRRCFAISKRFLPYHRILQALFSIISEKTFLSPSLKITMNTARTAIFFRQCFPLNSCPENINYCFKNLSGCHWFTPAAFSALIRFCLIPFHFRNKRFYLGPETI